MMPMTAFSPLCALSKKKTTEYDTAQTAVVAINASGKPRATGIPGHVMRVVASGRPLLNKATSCSACRLSGWIGERSREIH